MGIRWSIRTRQVRVAAPSTSDVKLNIAFPLLDITAVLAGNSCVLDFERCNFQLAAMMQWFDPGFADPILSLANIKHVARTELAANRCRAGRSKNDADRRVAVTPPARMIIPRGCDRLLEAMKGVGFNETRLTE